MNRPLYFCYSSCPDLKKTEKRSEYGFSRPTSYLLYKETHSSLPYLLLTSSASCGPPVSGTLQGNFSPLFFCCFNVSPHLALSLRTNDQQMDGGVKWVRKLAKKKGRDGQENKGGIPCGRSKSDPEWEERKRIKGTYEGLKAAQEGQEHKGKE